MITNDSDMYSMLVIQVDRSYTCPINSYYDIISTSDMSRLKYIPVEIGKTSQICFALTLESRSVGTAGPATQNGALLSLNKHL